MNNDLISREALKEQFTEGAYTSKGVREIIDNAPTVEALLTNEEVKDFAKENFDIGYEMAKAKYERPQGEYKRAFEIACDLLNGSVLYGIDADRLFALIMQEYEVVSPYRYQEFILNHLDRFSDDDEIRLKAIERLGW